MLPSTCVTKLVGMPGPPIWTPHTHSTRETLCSVYLPHPECSRPYQDVPLCTQYWGEKLLGQRGSTVCKSLQFKMHYAHVLAATQLTLPHVSSQGWIASSEVWGEGWRELDPLQSVPRAVGAAAEWAGRESHLGGVSERREEENVGWEGVVSTSQICAISVMKWCTHFHYCELSGFL